jgi:hypothetical protein
MGVSLILNLLIELNKIILCEPLAFFQDFGNMTHTHGIGNFGDVSVNALLLE